MGTITQVREQEVATAPRVQASLLGREREPCVTVDGFAADPDALRDAAAAAHFAAADQHYPGIRAPLPPGYLPAQLPIVARAITRHFGRCRQLRVVDASFSIVTHRPDTLTPRQRLPHVDAYGRERIAFVHYLSHHGDGTAFYRHRTTGFETVDESRAETYFGRLAQEVADAPAPHGYIAGDTDLFERTAQVEARYNRMVLYRSCLLHSGAISPDAALSPDPLVGRLTVTGFLAVE